MTQPSFDLLTQEWMPVRVGEENHFVGLRELFARAHELTDVETPLPPAASGLWRVLYVLAARVTGLDDPGLVGDYWHERRDAVWAEGRFDADAVTAYFDRYAGRFDLFHPDRPWLQDPRLIEQCGKASGVNKLVPARPAGNSQVWFAHHTDTDPRPVPTMDAAWCLLAQLYYGPSGRCTSRTVETTSEANTTAGPLRSVVSFHPVGDSVFESLLAGLPTPKDISAGSADVTPWEADKLPEPLRAPVAPRGIAGLAGRFQHAVLLSPAPDGRTVTDARITWAWRHKYGPTEDPYLIYQTSKQGSLYPRPADAGRAIFRDIDALLCKSHADPGVKRPDIVNDIQQLRTDVVKRLRVRVFGFDQDGQTRDKQWFAATTPRVLDMLEEIDPAASAGVSRWRRVAELAGRNLERALKRAWSAINDPSNGAGLPSRKDIGDGPWTARGAARYWPDAEREFWRLVGSRDYDADGKGFFRAAVRAFDEVTNPSTHRPRVARAVERARGLVFAGRTPTTDRIKEKT